MNLNISQINHLNKIRLNENNLKAKNTATTPITGSYSFNSLKALASYNFPLAFKGGNSWETAASLFNLNENDKEI